jgi:glycerol-3-phosphate O-acyltransferase
MNFLANEMISGEFQPGTKLIWVIQQIFKMRKGSLGKIFVKFSEAIDLNTYVNDF